MRDNPGGKLDPAEGSAGAVRRILPVLSCRGKRTRECCDRGSEVGTVNSE